MGLQRAGHNLVIKQQQNNTIIKTGSRLAVPHGYGRAQDEVSVGTECSRKDPRASGNVQLPDSIAVRTLDVYPAELHSATSFPTGETG